MEINDITREILRAAMKVHSALGPGLLESAYRSCLAHEIGRLGLRLTIEAVIPVAYDGIAIDIVYRIDLLVEDMVIVELKSVSKLLPLHEAQLLSYLKLSGLKVGLLINFNVKLLRHGIKRMVN